MSLKGVKEALREKNVYYSVVTMKFGLSEAYSILNERFKTSPMAMTGMTGFAMLNGGKGKRTLHFGLLDHVEPRTPQMVERVGKIIFDTLRDLGVRVQWDGDPNHTMTLA